MASTVFLWVLLVLALGGWAIELAGVSGLQAILDKAAQASISQNVLAYTSTAYEVRQAPCFASSRQCACDSALRRLRLRVSALAYLASLTLPQYIWCARARSCGGFRLSVRRTRAAQRAQLRRAPVGSNPAPEAGGEAGRRPQRDTRVAVISPLERAAALRVRGAWRLGWPPRTAPPCASSACAGDSTHATSPLPRQVGHLAPVRLAIH